MRTVEQRAFMGTFPFLRVAEGAPAEPDGRGPGHHLSPVHRGPGRCERPEQPVALLEQEDVGNHKPLDQPAEAGEFRHTDR